MKKIFKKAMSLVLASTILFTSGVSNVYAGQIEKTSMVSAGSEVITPFSEGYDELPDDTIICYMAGVAVHKYDIDENGVVKEGVLDGKKSKSGVNNSNASDSLKNSVADTVTAGKTYDIDSKEIKIGMREPARVNIKPYKNAMITTKRYIKAQRVNEAYTTNYLYLTAEEGAKYASKIETSTAESFAGLALGFLPKVGPVLTIAIFLKQGARAELCSQIRKYTDEGKKVCVIHGAISGVREWVGNTCDLVTQEPSIGNDHAVYEELTALSVKGSSYINPFKEVSINGKNYASKFKIRHKYTAKYKKNKKYKVKFTAKNNYTIKSISFNDGKKTKKIKNGSIIKPLNKRARIAIKVYDKINSKNIGFTIYFK